jgi:hypothetical protein
MLEMMGHMSPAMLRLYSHQRAMARRGAMDLVEARQTREEIAKVSATEGVQIPTIH